MTVTKESSDIMTTSSTILAIIPAYNEAERIAPVVGQSLEHLPVLVVDDGSTDDTAFVARQAGAELLVQQPNQGKGAALKAGFEYAIEREYAAVVTLDADGQHDPALVVPYEARSGAPGYLVDIEIEPVSAQRYGGDVDDRSRGSAKELDGRLLSGGEIFTQRKSLDIAFHGVFFKIEPLGDSPADHSIQ